MRKTVVVCDICGKDITGRERHPKVTIEAENRQTVLGLESGPCPVLGGKDLCADCQELLYRKVNEAIDKFFREHAGKEDGGDGASLADEMRKIAEKNLWW